MKCPNCSADILDDIEKCPFCKQVIQKKRSQSSVGKRKRNSGKGTDNSDNGRKEEDFDFTYTITSQDQIELIRQAVASLERNENGINTGEVEISVTRTPKNMDFEAELNKIKEEVSENYKLPTPKREALQQDTPRQEAMQKQKGKRKKNLFSVFSRSDKKSGGRRKKTYRISARGRRTLFFGACTAVLICLIAGGVRLAGNMFHRESAVKLPSYYVKENSLLQYYNENEVILTERLCLDEYAGTAVAATLVQPSENGLFTYFFENFNAAEKNGDLMVSTVKKPGVKTKIASAVSENFLISHDGKSVLFIQNGNVDGNMGSLQYWSQGMQESRKIASDMDGGNFVFSQNGKQALFIEKFNTTTHMGDLYLMDLRKDAERQKIDTDVCKVFGTDSTGKIFVYGQNYNAADKSYDVYIKSGDAEKRRISDHTALPPVISEQSTRLYAYGALNGETHNLYRIDLKKNQTEKIASDITEILKVSEDETQVLFRKVYATGFADYYIYTEGKETVKIADNVNSFIKTAHPLIPQFAISEDFSQIAYISGFDPAKERGALYIGRYRKGKPVQETKKITDEAYSCAVSLDGSTVWYAADYSVGRKVTDLYLYNRTESLKVADEILAEQFTFGKVGNTIVYMTDYNTESGCGRLTVADKKAKSMSVADDVAAFSLKENDDIVFLKEYDRNASVFDLYFAYAAGDGATRINSAVRQLLFY